MLLRARREEAGHGMYYLQSGLRDPAWFSKLLHLTLGQDLEQGNQGAAVQAKKALISITESVLLEY